MRKLVMPSMLLIVFSYDLQLGSSSGWVQDLKSYGFGDFRHVRLGSSFCPAGGKSHLGT
jgi:hypothetical protein